MPSKNPPCTIKGYLTVRIILPKSQDQQQVTTTSTSTSTTIEDETFFFVREHQGSKKSSGGGGDGDDGGAATTTDTGIGCTLFVANAPIVPDVSTKVLLKSIFGRYADVVRVSVVENPRSNFSESSSSSSSVGNNHSGATNYATWSEKVTVPSFLPTIYNEGKFAHVVFKSSKGLKKAMKMLQGIMTSKENNSSAGKKGNSNAIKWKFYGKYS